jgi:spore germination cell wall hydrolase CwlJ-like protein
MRWLLGVLLVLYCTELATPAKLPPMPRYTDKECLAWVVNDEARGEPLRGQKAVYDVVKHRMTVRNKTACEVVMEPHQFSGYKDGMFLHVDQNMLTLLTKLSKMRSVVPEAEYFHATYVKPSWSARMKKVVTIGLHTFYKKVTPTHKPTKENKNGKESNGSR